MLPLYLCYPWWNCCALANWHLSHALSLFLQCTSICLHTKYKWRYLRGKSFHQFGPLATFKCFIYLISVSSIYFLSFLYRSLWFILSHCFCFRIQVVKVVWSWVLTRKFLWHCSQLPSQSIVTNCNRSMWKSRWDDSLALFSS